MNRWPARILMALIRLYRALLSPLFPPSCRYEPSCSRYTLGAIERFGAGRGLLLGMRRILRCHPWSPGGFDPVPGTDRGGEGVHTDDHTAHCELETRTLHG